jgi:putative IMPACT (imprinted ancient) family translation regulator
MTSAQRRAKTVGMDLGTAKECRVDFTQYDRMLSDRGSVYSVTIGRAENRADIQAFLKRIKKERSYATATHNTYAARIAHDGAVYETKGDDGEAGAGLCVLRELQKADVVNVCVCVTRWFGGVKLMGDRFKHVQTATRYALERV